MSRLPMVTARQLVRALLKAGFLEKKQRGSHLRLFNPVTEHQTEIPMHPGDVPRGLLKAILK
jgi:predicted RNA binding protein YcfA (HicA-like mRNA interferase family)